MVACYAHIWLHIQTKSKVLAKMGLHVLLTHRPVARAAGNQHVEYCVPRLLRAIGRCTGFPYVIIWWTPVGNNSWHVHYHFLLGLECMSEVPPRNIQKRPY